MLSEATAPYASNGTINVFNRVWSPTGELLATASGTLICRPRKDLGPVTVKH